MVDKEPEKRASIAGPVRARRGESKRARREATPGEQGRGPLGRPAAGSRERRRADLEHVGAIAGLRVEAAVEAVVVHVGVILV